MPHMIGDRSDQVHLHPDDAARLDRLAELLEPVHALAKIFHAKYAAEEAEKGPESEPAKTIPPANELTGG